jgi:hypothetical protein
LKLVSRLLLFRLEYLLALQGFLNSNFALLLLLNPVFPASRFRLSP